MERPGSPKATGSRSCSLLEAGDARYVSFTGQDPLIIAGKAYTSRLIVGTGKYASYAQNAEAAEAAGAEIVTVALRRVNVADKGSDRLVDHLDPEAVHLPAQHGGLLHRRRRRAHAAPRARGGRLESR